MKTKEIINSDDIEDIEEGDRGIYWTGKITNRQGTLFIVIPKPISDMCSINENDVLRLKWEGIIKKGIPNPSKKPRKGLSNKIRIKILRRDKFKCVLCGRTIDHGTSLEVHHKIAISEGGKNSESNLQTLCYECHKGVTYTNSN